MVELMLRVRVGALLLVLGAGSPLRAQSEKQLTEETVRIPGPLPGLRLGLRHVVLSDAANRGSQSVVLILHGSAVPVSGNPGYPFGGRSMLQALALENLDVWALDYYGYGESDRYPEMNEPPDRHPPLGNAEQVADQVDSVVAFLRRRFRVEQIELIGDSRGSLVAGVSASRHPEVISRLVLFGPVTPFTTGPSPDEVLPAYVTVTPSGLWTTFTRWSEAAGAPPVLDASMYEAWAAIYLKSDPTSATRSPASVRIPNGSQADLAAIASGRFVYDPGRITAPTLIVMGEWDEIATLSGAEWLLRSLHRAPERRLTIIGRGSHTIQFEQERTQLYHVIASFLNEGN